MIAPIWTKMVDADIITMIPMMSKKMPTAFMVVLLISREQEQLLQRRRGARQRAPFSGQVIADTGRSLLPLAAKSLLIHANRSGRPRDTSGARTTRRNGRGVRDAAPRPPSPMGFRSPPASTRRRPAGGSARWNDWQASCPDGRLAAVALEAPGTLTIVGGGWRG
jgi:hypothetical protein